MKCFWSLQNLLEQEQPAWVALIKEFFLLSPSAVQVQRPVPEADSRSQQMPYVDCILPSRTVGNKSFIFINHPACGRRGKTKPKA